MVSMIRGGILTACALALGATRALSANPSEGDAFARGEATFRADIYPVLKAKCLRCHNSRKKDGALDMSSLKAMLNGGNSGPPIIPGNAKKSLMVDIIFFGEMPPKKVQPRMTNEELKLLEAWIDAGAPEGE